MNTPILRRPSHTLGSETRQPLCSMAQGGRSLRLVWGVSTKEQARSARAPVPGAGPGSAGRFRKAAAAVQPVPATLRHSRAWSSPPHRLLLPSPPPSPTPVQAPRTCGTASAAWAQGSPDSPLAQPAPAKPAAPPPGRSLRQGGPGLAPGEGCLVVQPGMAGW